MNRTLVLVVIAIALTASGVVGWHQIRTHGVSGVLSRFHMPQPPEAQATNVLMKAGSAIEKFHGERGTYVGADLSKYEGILVVSANDLSYCLTVVKEKQLYHLAGPGGIPGKGPC